LAVTTDIWDAVLTPLTLLPVLAVPLPPPPQAASIRAASTTGTVFNSFIACLHVSIQCRIKTFP